MTIRITQTKNWFADFVHPAKRNWDEVFANDPKHRESIATSACKTADIGRISSTPRTTTGYPSEGAFSQEGYW